MKTTKEMIDVMEAYLRGEKIERKFLDDEYCCWMETRDPLWDWCGSDYRVKTKKKYVPFDTAEEFLAAQREHGMYVLFGGNKAAAFINSNGIIRLTKSDNISNAVISELKYIFKDCTFEDGTPCGKEV